MESKSLDLKWDEGYLAKWLADRKSGTVKTYKIAMQLYAQFTEMTPAEMLQEKLDDMKKPLIEQGDVEARVKAFNRWLLKEYISPHTKKCLASRSALTYTSGIADFYSFFRVPLDLKWSKDFPASPLGKNETEKMTAEQVEKLASYASTIRDKAIIWILFQSGIDVSQVTSLTWGQIQKDMDNPQVIDGYRTVMLRGLERKKEAGTYFNTLFGQIAIRYLTLNLEKTYGKDWRSKMNYETHLFLGRSGKRHTSRYVQEMMRKIAPDSGIVGSRLEVADMNLLSPMSLRSSFAD